VHLILQATFEIYHFLWQGKYYIFARHLAILIFNSSFKLLIFKSSNKFVYNINKGKGDDQTNWRVLRHEKLARLREKLRNSKEQASQG
jgi:hypothetical protein